MADETKTAHQMLVEGFDELARRHEQEQAKKDKANPIVEINDGEDDLSRPLYLFIKAYRETMRQDK